MSSEEIIEYEGRRFVRTGEVRPTEKGEFFWWAKLECVRQAEGRGFFPREILREFPAETPAPPVTDWRHDDHCICITCRQKRVCGSLLAEAEEAISRLIGMVVTMQNLHGDHITKFIIDSQPFNWAQSVQARIRAAKEKQS